jgi:DNA-binding NtrC family response regulator
MTGARVLILDDDIDLLDLMGDVIFRFCGRPVLKVASLRDLIMQKTSAFGCGVAFIDINLGPDCPSGIEAYQWLRSNKFCGHLSFLTAHAHTHPLVRKARELDNVSVLEKPIDVDRLIRTVEEGSRDHR